MSRCCECTVFYVHVTVHRNKLLCNKTNEVHKFHKFILSWNSTCFGQFVCSSPGVYSLYNQQWYMSYRSAGSFGAGTSWSCSKAVYKPVWCIPLLSVLWINSWWWTDELSETWQNVFVKLVHLIGFITKKCTVLGRDNSNRGKEIQISTTSLNFHHVRSN